MRRSGIAAMPKWIFVLALLFTCSAFGAEEAAETPVADTPMGDANGGYPVNILWTVLAAVLVFWMQAGFAMVEAGFTRAKNAGNIMMKNLMDFSMGSLAFWLVGSLSTACSLVA